MCVCVCVCYLACVSAWGLTGYPYVRVSPHQYLEHSTGDNLAAAAMRVPTNEVSPANTNTNALAHTHTHKAKPNYKSARSDENILPIRNVTGTGYHRARIGQSRIPNVDDRSSS